MTCNEDLVYGYGIDDRLNELYRLMPGAFQDDPLSTAAGLIWLDERFGLRQEGDYVLLNPSLAMWFLAMVKPTDAVLARDIQAAADDESEGESELVQSIVRRTSEQPFEVRCESPEGDEYTQAYPEYIRGKTITVRIMTEHEMAGLSFAYTVRADGTFIYRPGFKSQLAYGEPRTLQDVTPR